VPRARLLHLPPQGAPGSRAETPSVQADDDQTILTMALLTTAGTVIEADDDQDLPEQMLAGVYLTYLDPAKCRPFDPTLTRYLNDERNLIPPLTGSL